MRNLTYDDGINVVRDYVIDYLYACLDSLNANEGSDDVRRNLEDLLDHFENALDPGNL